MSQDPPADKMPVREHELDELLSETRMLRRRVSFWQHTVWLLLGGAVILGTVVWQRGELRRRECFQSLGYFADQAKRLQLDRSQPDILEHQWQFMDQGWAKLNPLHYDLIMHNWLTTPKPGEDLPLAVCRESHFITLSRGRHVLFKSVDAMRVVWSAEEDVADVAAQAAKDNRPG